MTLAGDVYRVFHPPNMSRIERKEIVAIDGEGGAGKSLCAVLAKRLGFAFLDSGSIYRAITYMVLEARVDFEDPIAVDSFVRDNIHRLTFSENAICLSGIVLGNEIRTPEINKIVPHIAKMPTVRKRIIPLQRSFAGGTKLVAEGRDMTTVVFADAKVKIYLTAKLETRAKRRYDQHLRNGDQISIEEVTKDLEARDHHDRNREHSPLTIAPDAVVVDTTHMTKEEVVDRMLEICREKLNLPALAR